MWWLLLISLGLVLANLDALNGADELRTENSLTVGRLEEMVQTKLTPGLSRREAEDVLRAWGAEPAYVPKERFALNSATTIVIAPPPETVGALVVIMKPLEDHGIYDPFVVIVIHIGRDDRVLAAGSKVLGDGP